MKSKITLSDIFKKYEGVPPECVQLPPEEAGVVIGGDANPIDTGTLANWRSTGKHNLPFVKHGRIIRYPLAGLLEFNKRHTVTNTGEAA